MLDSAKATLNEIL
jgi:hypothetical protein